jgi:hypothetical protein
MIANFIVINSVVRMCPARTPWSTIRVCKYPCRHRIIRLKNGLGTASILDRNRDEGNNRFVKHLRDSTFSGL